MRVWIDGLQAGNRSGTGRYTTELIRALLASDSRLKLRIFWPKHIPAPTHGPRADFVAIDLSNRLGRFVLPRFWLEQMGREAGSSLAHYPASFGPLWLGSKAVPLVLTVHDVSFLRHPEWFRWNRARYYRFAIKRSVRRARRIIADSQAAAGDLQELLGVPEDRIDVVPLGVEEAFRPASEAEKAAVRARYALPGSFFLFVGTLEPRKNLPRLIEAWSRIASEVEQDLVIAGREGWKVGPVKQAITGSPHRQRIHSIGFVEEGDLPALLSAAHGFVWPSLFEGFGLPPLEAMACGTPVLTSDTSSLPEVVGDAAVTVDPHDAGAIAEGLRRLANDDALCAALRENGRARAAGFTWERTARLTLDSYRKALG